MKRAARGLDVPQGTAGQESAALKCFGDFLALANMTESSIEGIAKSLLESSAQPSQNFYSLLTAFSIFLQTRKSARGGPLAKATAVGYMSQVVNLLREKYPNCMRDSKRISKIREKMAAAIEERNVLAGVQTGEAPGCTLNDLRTLVQETAIMGVGSGFKSLHDSAVLTLMWHTFGRAIDTCFARKNQLSVAASGELFLHIARIKTSVVLGISIYKSAVHWEQCMLHALGMMFVGASEPSSYLFPLVPHAAASDLPGAITYSQDEAIVYWENLDEKASKKGEPAAKRYQVELPRLPPALTTGLTSHSLRRSSAACANASPKLAIQWISTRGAWLLDSLTKAFAYVGTATRENQSVGKILAGHNDPHLPCATPSIRTLAEILAPLQFAQLLSVRSQLFKNVFGFTDVNLNVDGSVLDAVMGSLLIHLHEVAAAVTKEQAATGYTSYYIYQFHVALDATNTALNSGITLATCIGWGQQLRTAWEMENFAQLGGGCGGDTAVLTLAITQMLSSIAAMQRTLGKLVALQEQKDSPADAAQLPALASTTIPLTPTSSCNIIAEAH